jgi:transcriptional regulator with XRE-family HTH domain
MLDEHHHAHAQSVMVPRHGATPGQAERMARRTSRPTYVIAWYRGLAYELDLVKCRRALVHRQIEGELDSMESLARSVGISRSTASRYFSGRPTSLTVTLKILERLGLKFADIAKPVDAARVA